MATQIDFLTSLRDFNMDHVIELIILHLDFDRKSISHSTLVSTSWHRILTDDAMWSRFHKRFASTDAVLAATANALRLRRPALSECALFLAAYSESRKMSNLWFRRNHDSVHLENDYDSGVSRLLYVPRRRTVVSGHEDGSVAFYAVDTMTLTARFPSERCYRGGCRSVLHLADDDRSTLFSCAGCCLRSFVSDSSNRWECHSAAKIGPPDVKTTATVLKARDRRAFYVDILSNSGVVSFDSDAVGAPKKTSMLHDSGVDEGYAIDIEIDDKNIHVLMSRGGRSFVQIFCIHTIEKLRCVELKDVHVREICSFGDILLCASDKRIHFLDGATGHRVGVVPFPLSMADYSLNVVLGKWVTAMSRFNAVTMFDGDKLMAYARLELRKRTRDDVDVGSDDDSRKRTRIESENDEGVENRIETEVTLADAIAAKINLSQIVSSAELVSVNRDAIVFVPRDGQPNISCWKG